MRQDGFKAGVLRSNLPAASLYVAFQSARLSPSSSSISVFFSLQKWLKIAYIVELSSTQEFSSPSLFPSCFCLMVLWGYVLERL